MEDALPKRNHAFKVVAVYDDRTNPHAAPIHGANCRQAILLRTNIVSEMAITLSTRILARREMIYRGNAPQATIFRVTGERWSQIGISIEFLIVVRVLGEFFRLRHLHGANFSTAVAALYIGGALIAVCSCWAGVTLYFFRRYILSAWITLATIPVLLVYKIAVIGW